MQGSPGEVRVNTIQKNMQRAMKEKINNAKSRITTTWSKSPQKRLAEEKVVNNSDLDIFKSSPPKVNQAQRSPNSSFVKEKKQEALNLNLKQQDASPSTEGKYQQRRADGLREAAHLLVTEDLTEEEVVLNSSGLGRS